MSSVFLYIERPPSTEHPEDIYVFNQNTYENWGVIKDGGNWSRKVDRKTALLFYRLLPQNNGNCSLLEFKIRREQRCPGAKVDVNFYTKHLFSPAIRGTLLEKRLSLLIDPEGGGIGGLRIINVDTQENVSTDADDCCPSSCCAIL